MKSNRIFTILPLLALLLMFFAVGKVASGNTLNTTSNSLASIYHPSLSAPSLASPSSKSIIPSSNPTVSKNHTLSPPLSSAQKNIQVGQLLLTLNNKSTVVLNKLPQQCTASTKVSSGRVCHFASNGTVSVSDSKGTIGLFSKNVSNFSLSLVLPPGFKTTSKKPIALVGSNFLKTASLPVGSYLITLVSSTTLAWQFTLTIS